MEVIEVIEKEVEVIEVIERGPQGPAGAGISTLTTKGDLLYRGDTTGERLPIGTSGQILKVSATGIPEWGAAPSSGVSSVSGTAPIVSSGGATPAISITAATTSAAGSMSAADKLKLDGIAASSATPQPLGVAAAGTSGDFSRSDHVHAMPSAADVGATPLYNADVYNPSAIADVAYGLRSSDDSVILAGTTPTEVEINPDFVDSIRSGLGLGTAATADIGTGAGDVCAADDARLSDTRDPNAHAASHAAGQADELFDQSLNTTDSPTFAGLIVDLGGGPFSCGPLYIEQGATTLELAGAINFGQAIDPSAAAATTRTSLELGDAALEDSTAFAAASHTHTPSEVGLGNVSNTAQVTSVSGTAPIVSSCGTTPAISITDATTSASGAAGDDSRITGAAQKSANLSDLASASTARTNLGLGTAAVEAASAFAAAGHTHAQLHDRSHAITSTSDHTASNWQVFYSNGSGQITELALGAANTVLTSNGASSAPSFAAASGGGATNLWISASAWIPRTTGGCGVDSREIGATNRVNVDELLFDTGTEEFAQALVVMPSNYNNGTVTCRFYWTASSGSGGVAWGISGRAYGDDDALDQASGTRVVVTDTLLASNDVHVTSATSAVTIDGTPAANKAINFQISRVVADNADTLAVDARFLGCEIIYTAA